MNPILEKTHVAGAGGLTQYAAIVLNDSNEAILPGGANAARFGGIAQAPYVAGLPARIMKAGISYVVAGGVFKPGDELVISGVTGKLVKAGTTNDIIQNVVAIAEEAAGADGDQVLALIQPRAKTMFAVLSLRATDLLGANTVLYGLVSPIAGTIVRIDSVLKGAALATGNATLTGKIGGNAITTGVITITQAASAIGDKDTCAPSALNVLAVGDELQFLVGGTNSQAAAFAEITVLVKL